MTTPLCDFHAAGAGAARPGPRRPPVLRRRPGHGGPSGRPWVGIAAGALNQAQHLAGRSQRDRMRCAAFPWRDVVRHPSCQCQLLIWRLREQRDDEVLQRDHTDAKLRQLRIRQWHVTRRVCVLHRYAGAGRCRFAVQCLCRQGTRHGSPAGFGHELVLSSNAPLVCDGRRRERLRRSGLRCLKTGVPVASIQPPGQRSLLAARVGSHRIPALLQGRRRTCWTRCAPLDVAPVWRCEHHS